MTFPGYVLVFVFYLMKSIEAKVQPLIVGGNYTSIKNYPHAAFFSTGGQSCGASILNHYILLTAAHCLDTKGDDEDIYVVTGTTKLVEPFTIIRGIGVRVHKNWNHRKMLEGVPLADIALIKLESPLKFGKRVKRIAIMKSPPYDSDYDPDLYSDSFNHEPASIAGWGATDLMDPGSWSPRLKHMTDLEVWPREECMDRFEEFGRGVADPLPKDTFCAGYSGRLTGFAYYGDSGSALIVRDYIQIGIASTLWGTKEGKLLPFQVYTDVVYYYNWIMRNAKKLYCENRKSKLLYRDCL